MVHHQEPVIDLGFVLAQSLEKVHSKNQNRMFLKPRWQRKSGYRQNNKFGLARTAIFKPVCFHDDVHKTNQLQWDNLFLNGLLQS